MKYTMRSASVGHIFYFKGRDQGDRETPVTPRDRETTKTERPRDQETKETV